MTSLLRVPLAIVVCCAALTGVTHAAAASSATESISAPNATWRDCQSYGKRARTGCLTGQTVQPWQQCPASLVGWYTLTKSTNALVQCRKSGASTKWVWA